MSSEPLVLGVSDFVAVLNQTLEFAYPSVYIVGELSNFRVSKNKWVYFDLKDEMSSVKFFGSVFLMPGPLEDGIIVQVRAQPKLHQQFGFSMTFQSIMPVGEGSLRRAVALLEAKLKAEGLFDPSRKRVLPYPPKRVGLIASAESAAYHDFIKILHERWGGADIDFYDVQVQGENAPIQIIRAIEYFNGAPNPVEVLVITRGGGSPEDLAAFNNEAVARTVAVSRIPTLVAIGHEVDTSLAEMVADVRASTPTNAAQILVPDTLEEQAYLSSQRRYLEQQLEHISASLQHRVLSYRIELNHAMQNILSRHKDWVSSQAMLLSALDPSAVLRRGYAVIRSQGKVIKSVKKVMSGEEITAQLSDGSLTTIVKKVNLN